MSGTVRLANLIEKAHVKRREFDCDEELEAFGVSNTDGITRTAHRKSDDLGEYLVIEPGSFAYNPYRVNVGSIGLTPANVTGVVSPAYVVFRVKKKELIPEVLLDFLKSSEGLRQINKLARGAVRKALRYEDLCEIEFPAIPYERQLEILKHKRGFNKQHASLLSEINHQQSLIAKLKQAILQDAIQGKLTADWRTAHPDVEPASQLLKRIQAEKARLIAAKKIRPEKPLPKITPAEIPFEIPKGWEWCRMGEAGIFQRGKSKHRPRNDPRLFENGDIPFVQTGDVARSKRHGFMIITSTGYYNEAGLAQSRLWPKGTMCITIAANIAETGFLTFPACIPDSVVTFTPTAGGKTPQFLRMFIELTRTSIEQFAPATAQKNINLEIINELMLPLPPLAE